MTDPVETRIAIIETKISSMEEAFRDLAEAQKSLARDVHAIRELIAIGKGVWWVLVAFAGLAGGAGALMHKLFSGTP